MNAEGRAKRNNSIAKKGLLIAIALCIVVLGYAWSIIHAYDPPPQQPAATQATEPRLDKSPNMQAERKKIIQEVIGHGYFTRVEQNGTAMPRAWVTPKFTESDFQDKENVLSIVYSYYFDGTSRVDSLALIDSRTGKEIGRFDQAGLRQE
jgi:hypothetical protein